MEVYLISLTSFAAIFFSLLVSLQFHIIFHSWDIHCIYYYRFWQINYRFCIVEYSKAEDAKKAILTLDGLKLDKAHVFCVSAYSALDTADNTPDVYEEPTIVIPDRPNLKQWLLDARGQDQFVIRWYNC